MVVVELDALSSPPLRLQAGLTPESPAALGRPRRPHVLQGGAAAQSGVIVGGGVRADVVVLLGHRAGVPAVTQ